MRRSPALFVFAATLACVLVPFARGEEIRAVSERLDEKIDSIEIQQGRAVLKTANRTIPLEQVKQIRFDERAVVDSAGAKVVLANKDEIRGTIGAGDNNGFQLKTSCLGTVTVSLDSAVALFFDTPPETERKLAAKLLDWVGQPGFQGRPDKDAVYVRAGGKVEGIVNSVSASGISIDAGKQLGVLPFTLKEVELVVFGNAGGKPPAPPSGTVVRVRTTDGSVVSGAIQKLGSGQIVLEGNPLGGSSTVTVQLKDAVELFVLNGAFVYLSDLNPTKVDEKFPEGFERDPVTWGWKRDREVKTGARLRLGGRTFDKGLGVHAYSSLTFDLAGAFKKFRATVGIDEGVRYYNPREAGRVVFRVLVDGKPAKELSDGIAKKKGEPGTEIEVDVQGAKELTLVADYGGFLHVLGRADWADAHLVK
jgi:hypothetical protein